MATPLQQQPPTKSNNTKWKQKFENQRSMKPTLIKPPSKPTNHHNYSSSGHQKPNPKLKTRPEYTKTNPPKPNTHDPAHQNPSPTTHPTTDLITDLYHNRGSGCRFAPALLSSRTLMPIVKSPKGLPEKVEPVMGRRWVKVGWVVERNWKSVRKGLIGTIESDNCKCKIFYQFFKRKIFYTYLP